MAGVKSREKSHFSHHSMIYRDNNDHRDTRNGIVQKRRRPVYGNYGRIYPAIARFSAGAPPDTISLKAFHVSTHGK